MPRPPEGMGSWPNEVSQEGFVYLTETHSLHYAMSPERPYRGDYALLGVSLNDVPETRLYPDEDYLEQETWPRGAHCNDLDWSLDIGLQQHRWLDSLNKMGNVAVAGVIPPTAITRYAILSKNRLFWERFYRPESDRNITRYQARKAKLQESLSLFFDDVPKWKGMNRSDFNGMMEGRSAEDRAVLWAAVQAIQVVTLDKGKVSHRTGRNLPLPTEIDFLDDMPDAIR